MSIKGLLYMFKYGLIIFFSSAIVILLFNAPKWLNLLTPKLAPCNLRLRKIWRCTGSHFAQAEAARALQSLPMSRVSVFGMVSQHIPTPQLGYLGWAMMNLIQKQNRTRAIHGVRSEQLQRQVAMACDVTTSICIYNSDFWLPLIYIYLY